MIDIHSHILAGLDDGAGNTEVSLALLRMAEQAGTTGIIATPHIIEGKDHADWQTIVAGAEELDRLARKDALNIRVYPGAELEMNWDALALLKTGRSDYCLAGSRYVLIELPANSVPGFAEEFLYEVGIREKVPIIAHPERHRKLAAQPRLLHQWLRNGALAQCNADSFKGKYGADAKKYAELLLENNMVHFLGSDAHNIEHRHTDVGEALAVIAAKAGPEALRRLTCLNPEAIIADSFLDVAIPKEITPPKNSRKGFFAGLFS